MRESRPTLPAIGRISRRTRPSTGQEAIGKHRISFRPMTDLPADLPIACTLDSVTLEARRSMLLPGLTKIASGRSALPDGLRLTFEASADTLAAITRMIEAERQCCRFLRFRLTIEPGAGPFVLEISGPVGTAAFLEGLLAR